MILICIACGTSEINSYFAVNYAMREEDLLCAIIMFTKRVRDRSYLIWKLNTKFVSSIRNTWNALVPTSCFDCMKSKMSTVIMIVDWTSRKTSGYKYSRGCITRIPLFFCIAISAKWWNISRALSTKMRKVVFHKTQTFLCIWN